MLQLRQQGAAVAGAVHRRADMGVEVAVRALGGAEGPVDVEGQGFRHRRAGRGGRGQGGGLGHAGDMVLSAGEGKGGPSAPTPAELLRIGGAPRAAPAADG